jgi:hypothetical protein
MSSYNESLQRFFALYKEAGHEGSPSTKDVARWAYENGLWQPRTSDVINVLAEDLSRAWREEYRTDAKGRRYRAKHPVRKSVGGKQLFLWEDMDTAPQEHMVTAFSQRRQQIVGDCVQLRVDIDAYNDKNPGSLPIQTSLNFTHDVEEALLGDDEEKKAA